MDRAASSYEAVPRERIQMQALIVSFDSLATNSLGCYGNDWVETPNWDRLAATGVVFDQHFSDAIGRLAGMAWATGKHSLSPQDLSTRFSPGSRLHSNGIATHLVSSAERAWCQRAEFDKVTIATGRDGIDCQPDDVPFAQVVKAGLAAWHDESFQKQSRLLWLHSPGPGVPPRGFDSLYFEDFEERGVNFEELSDEARSRHVAVYGGAVSLMDYWLGVLLQGIEKTSQPTLIVVMAAQGHLWQQIPSFRTNETQIEKPILSDQRIRTPLTLKVIGDERFERLPSLRSNRLVQTIDLAPTLFDWFGVAEASTEQKLAGQSWLRECTSDVPAREFLWIGDNDGHDAVRTGQWLCVRETRAKTTPSDSTSDSDFALSLFAKPEDIWDVNDIALQQPDIVTELLRHIP